MTVTSPKRAVVQLFAIGRFTPVRLPDWNAQKLSNSALSIKSKIIHVIINMQYATPTGFLINHRAGESSGMRQLIYMYLHVCKTRVNVVRVAYQIHELYTVVT